MENNNLSMLDMLTIFSVILQLQTYDTALKQVSNDDLMRELRNQNMAYFEKIIDNQNLIIQKLTESG